jgi:hypothetical protein
VRIHHDLLNLPNKHYFWVEEYWNGFSPTLTYQEQHQALLRYADSLDYVEHGWEEKKIAMLFQLPDRSGIVYLALADSPAEFAEFLKTNEAHVRMAPEQRKVRAMLDWETAKEGFLQMIARLTVRASYESSGHRQPPEHELDAEATQWRASAKLRPLFERLSS